MKSPFLYLASRSPRRKELLTQAGVGFRVFIPKKEELVAPKTFGRRVSPSAIVRRISKAKASAALAELKEKGVKKGLILSADTLVFQKGKVLGKPRDKADARRMLKKLSGSWHLVSTAVTCLAIESGKMNTIHVNSKVKFFRLKEEWIRWYIATGEPMDKAGAYGAQGFGTVFIERFSGSYTNVVGLPVAETIGLLEKISGKSRAKFLGKI